MKQGTIDYPEMMHQINGLKLIDYPLKITTAGWTTIRAMAHYYQTSGGIWRLTFNFAGNFGSGILHPSFAISGIVFKNISGYNQAVSVSNDAFTDPCSGQCLAGSGNIYVSNSAARAYYYVSGDVELDGVPT